MARLDIDYGFGDPVDEKTMLVDRWQYADGDAPLVRRCAIFAFGSRRNPASISPAIAAKRSPLAVGITPSPLPLEQGAAERGFQLVDLFAERRLADVGAAAAAETRRRRCTMLK